MTIREALSEDFESVYPLLQKLHNQNLTKRDWNRLFVNHFNSDEKFHGILIEDRERTVGFLGVILSYRTINDKQYKFCNTTSWIVEDAYRSQSLIMLMRVHKLKDFIFTNFTPSETVYPILKKLGYKDIDNEKCLLMPKPALLFNTKILTKGFENVLNDCDLKIYKSHVKLNASFFLATINNEYCFFVLRKKSYSPHWFQRFSLSSLRINIAEIEYISNPSLFKKYYKGILFNVGLKLKIARFIIYKKHLPEKVSVKAKTYKYHRKFVFKGNIEENEIDTLFSELFVLNI